MRAWRSSCGAGARAEVVSAYAVSRLAATLAGAVVLLLLHLAYPAISGAALVPMLAATVAPLFGALSALRHHNADLGAAVSTGLLAIVIVGSTAVVPQSAAWLLPWAGILLFEAIQADHPRIWGGGVLLCLGSVIGAGLAHPVQPAALVEVLTYVAVALLVHKLWTWKVAPEFAEGAELTASPVASEDMIVRFRRNGDVDAVSGNVADRLGVEPSDLTGNQFLTRVHVLDRPAVLTAIDRAASGLPARVEIRLSDTDGEYGDYEVHCRPGETGDDVVDAVFRDISEIRQLRDSLVQQQETMRAHDESQARILANVSHELRTPLNAIIGFSEVLEQQPFGPLAPEKTREYAGLIGESGRHLLELVNGILDMSKLQAGHFVIHPEPCDIIEIMRKCATIVAPALASARLSVAYDFVTAMPEMTVDPRAMRQIMLNLLSNAIKFSRPGGRIMIGAYESNGEAVLYVADEGIGIAKGDIERLGKPFVQLNASYDSGRSGAGLGLCMVFGLAELHGGSATIDSVKGRGTRVTVRLPVTAARPELRGEGKIVPLRSVG
ncbi:MAG: ATP-binding protein [Flavobacteriaceae bacterium]